MYYVDASCNFTGERTSDPSHATATKVQIYIIDQKKNIYIYISLLSAKDILLIIVKCLKAILCPNHRFTLGFFFHLFVVTAF